MFVAIVFEQKQFSIAHTLGIGCLIWKYDYTKSFKLNVQLHGHNVYTSNYNYTIITKGNFQLNLIVV